MSVTVRIPTQLRELSAGASEVQLDAGTVAELLAGLQTQFPGFGERLFDDSGALRRFVNVFVAEEDIRFLDGLDTAVADGQVLSIIPAVAGGLA
ncbi:MAG: MoaD/ThiS family protein [Acidimicrobiia bacterium]